MAAAILLLAGCGGRDETVTVYLEARLGPDGPPGQLAPVLTPVERSRRDAMSQAWQAVSDLRVGPSPAQRARGLRDTLSSETRLRRISVVKGTATIDLEGREPDLYASAALLYTLTELPGVERVQLRLGGRPCCFYRHDGRAVASGTRDALDGWQGEPCALRGADVPHCRS
ncbi:MAG: GerMN domain-containing protein [Gaiellaceae bacterium]